MRISVFRKEHFNAAHRLNNPTWDEVKNKAVFGLCNNDNYHGHNYTLIVKLTGEVDPDTGYLMDLKDLKAVIRRCILEKFDHRNLNLDLKEFEHLNPTAEHIAFVIWTILRKEINLALDLSIKLFETERNFVEYNGK